MNANTRVSGYVAVLRKHSLLLIGAILVVLASGGFYLWRQVPVYEAEALLLIEQPVRNLVGGGPKRNYFAISQAALNTELFLLRENEELAQRAIDSMADGPGPLLDPPPAPPAIVATTAAEREQQADAEARYRQALAGHERELGPHLERLDVHRAQMAALGYSESALRGKVSVSQVIGAEGLVRFSLTGVDASELPSAVNAYADAYRQDAQAKRTRTFEMTKRDLDRRRRAALDAVNQAEQARTRFATAEERKSLDLVRGVNPAEKRRAALDAQLPDLRQRALEDRTSLRHMVDALEEIDVEIDGMEPVASDPDAPIDVTLRMRGEVAPLYEALADSALVSGLGSVRNQPAVGRLRESERTLEGQDRELADQGVLEGHEKRKAVAERLLEARVQRGRITARAIEIQLTDIAHRARHFEDVTRRLEEAREEETSFNNALAEYEQLTAALDAAKREYEESARKLEDFTSIYLQRESEEANEESSERTPLRISIRVPAENAKQVAPKVPLIVGMTVVAALMTGLGLVFLFEFLDDTIRSKEDFDRYVGLPFLGFIPRIKNAEHESIDTAAESNAGSAVAESFRAVRTSILFTKQLQRGHSILVTSAGPGEGKTTIATNLAIAFARKKGPVLLVDADLRKPRVGKALGLDVGLGLSTVLAGQAKLDDVLRPTRIDGLMAVTSGPIPPNPAELLHGERMEEFLAAASERFECVIVDTPPLVAVSDARVLASRVDAFLMVISMGKTSRRLIQRAVESLTSIGFGVDGVVLNNMNAAESRYGDYYYAREYRHE